MWGPIAFVGTIALLVGIVYLFMIAAAKAAKKGDQQAADAELDRREPAELDAMILAALAYERKREQERAIAEWESTR